MMKILSVHNSYQLPGGEDQVFAQEADLLRSHGHEVVLYQASNEQVNGVNPLGPAREHDLEQADPSGASRADAPGKTGHRSRP